MLKYAIYCDQWEMVIMTNALLLKSIPYVEFDYQTLQDAVRGYSQPRTKISGMLTMYTCYCLYQKGANTGSHRLGPAFRTGKGWADSVIFRCERWLHHE